jgi:hypothetical protein
MAIAGSVSNDLNGVNRVVTSVDKAARTFTFTAGKVGLAGPFTGSLTYTSFKQTGSYRPVLNGVFASGDPATIFIGGDSIDVGTGSTASEGGIWGGGRNSLALRDPGAGTNFTAYLHAGGGGSLVSQYTGSQQNTWPYMKYCKHAMGAHLTNSFNGSGTGQTGAQMLALMRPWWAALRANGIDKILVLGAQTRGSSTDGWVTEENQTIGAGWLAGANVEQYYALLPTEVAEGRVTAFLNFQSWRGTDPNKWKVHPTFGRGTTDSTHPAPWVHTAEAYEELRPRLASLGMLA